MPKTVIYTGRFDRYRVDVPREDQAKPDRLYFSKGEPVEVPDEVAARVLPREDFTEAETPTADTSPSTVKPRSSGRSGASGSSDEETK